MKLTGKKLILILLYAPTGENQTNDPIAGRTRLMKMVFLFEQEVLGDLLKDKNFEEVTLPEFFAWKYGPFSSDLLNDLEFLVNQGYVCRSDKRQLLSDLVVTEAELREYDFWIEDIGEFQSQEYDEEVFELSTDKGIEKGKELWEMLTNNQKKYLQEFKKTLNSAPLSRILEYVYKKYRKDGYIDKSLIRERYLA